MFAISDRCDRRWDCSFQPRHRTRSLTSTAALTTVTSLAAYALAGRLGTIPRDRLVQRDDRRQHLASQGTTIATSLATRKGSAAAAFRSSITAFTISSAAALAAAAAAGAAVPAPLPANDTASKYRRSHVAVHTTIPKTVSATVPTERTTCG